MKKKSFRAFTLIETLVAISVLLLSLAGPLSIAASALQSANYARDEVTAFYLAQEAIEYIRAIRDQNLLAGDPWLTGLDETSSEPCVSTVCIVDVPNFEHQECDGACPKLKISSGGQLFNQSDGDESPFTRSVTITRVDDPDIVGDEDEEAIITVTMTWESTRLSRSIQVSEHIFRWLQ